MDVEVKFGPSSFKTCTLSPQATPARPAHSNTATTETGAPLVQEAVTDRLNVPRLIQERQAKEKEAKLCHDLAIKLIDIGYKVLGDQTSP